MDCVKKELANENNFSLSPLSADDKLKEVKNSVNNAVLDARTKGQVSEDDKVKITGLNENDNPMHSHVFKPVTPYVYPLFKYHKLSPDEIAARKVPPIRLVHATREGPLYRLEKYVSPYLTTVSRDYCSDEFLLDTPHLLSNIKQTNEKRITAKFGNNINLFCLDVIALYPSINPEMALNALKICLDITTKIADQGRKDVIHSFTDLIFKNSYVTFQDKVYTSKNGIPTGNCVSRQIADVYLHWLLFTVIKPQMETLWALILFWKRFIDDIIGLWVGSKRQFECFVTKLNHLAKPFGIQFGDSQFGRSVNYLDVTLSLDDSNNIEYRLFKKETDARLFLKTDSYHPAHVFKSVVFSQMIRVIQRNSRDDTCVEDLEELKGDLRRSGHGDALLESKEPEAVLRAIENDLYDGNRAPATPDNKLVFSVKYFDEVRELKQLINGVRGDIQQLCGDTQVTFALRKQPSIGNRVVRNRKLSDVQAVRQGNGPISQKCGGKGCLTCPFLFNSDDVIRVNGTEIRLDFSLNCKDSSIIYLAQCQICSSSPIALKEDTYFGQTVTPMHVRMNGHRGKFKIDENLLFEQSALSMHCYLAHRSQFDMKHFKLGIVKKVRPMELDREEDMFINRFRTNIFGLNRIVVVR